MWNQPYLSRISLNHGGLNSINSDSVNLFQRSSVEHLGGVLFENQFRKVLPFISENFNGLSFLAGKNGNPSLEWLDV